MTERAQRVIEFVQQTYPDGLSWLARAWDSARQLNEITLRAMYASVPRRLGAAANERPTPPAPLESWSRPHWTLTDWVRLSLIATVPEAEQPRLARKLFESGEIGEQESLLRTLSGLGQPERFTETAIEACRTNAQRVFEAIVCENDFPARHFPELNFNQMVLKAIFLEVPVRRIEGLEDRITPELQRMVRDYASERRAAGRSVSEDMEHIMQRGET